MKRKQPTPGEPVTEEKTVEKEVIKKEQVEMKVDTIERPKYIAVVKEWNIERSDFEVRFVEAATKRELEKALSDQNVDIAGIMRGKHINYTESRKVNF